MILGEDAIIITKEEAKKLLTLLWNGVNMKKFITKCQKIGVWELVDGLRMAIKDKEE